MVLNFVTIKFTKMEKLNPKSNIFGISFLRSGISETVENYEKVCPALILNHIIVNKARNIHLYKEYEGISC